ncbi:MAG: fasciclin domain-containing protein [Duncaniella sp.]|nr:fasciclin domain-containing protein [Duncaniella sp.]
MKIISSRLSRLAVTAAAVMALPLWVGCSDLDDDDHYAQSTTEIRNPELKIVSQTSEEYIKSQASLSDMYELLNSADIFKSLRDKGQLATILMVENSDMVLPVSKASDDAALDFLIKSHVSDISMSPANLHDGDRLMMWNNKYVNISMDEEALNGSIIGHIMFNNGVVKEVIQTSNGYIYVISELIQTPTSLSDYIDNLSDEYSIFRELIKSSGGKEFLKNQSKPLYINSEGNTVYDSVFRYTNDHFDAVGFDLNSESLTATMLLPSDEVINEALADAHSRLAKWDLERSDEAIKNWILDVCFFNKRYSVADLEVPASLVDPETQDVNSVFSKQWRKSAHHLYTADNSEELSNGVVHKISKLYIPTNVLIYRLKDWFYHYEVCTDVQKSSYFAMSNMQFKNCETREDASFTPLPGVWPFHEVRLLNLSPESDDSKEDPFTLNFTPIKRLEDANGNTVIRPYLIPPGTYRLAFGSKQNQNININVSVLVNGQVIAKSEGEIILGTSTAYHYDRGTTLSDRYPEGYDATYVADVSGNKRASNYDTDGGLLISEVVIPDVNGDGSGVPIMIRFEGANWYGQSAFTFCHWCLRPTVNCY